MKLESLAEKTRSLLPVLACPLCGTAFSLNPSHSLICENRHCYDLSRKGYANLAPSHIQEADTYNAQLFDCRRQIFETGFYAPVMTAIGDIIAAHTTEDEPFTLLDAGCGEGSYAHALSARFPSATIIGLDLNRDAIIAAARKPGLPHWLVGNVSRLPVADGSLGFLLDVLTPADYSAFFRALTEDGLLLKVIPGKDYLKEIRAFIKQELRTKEYDNGQVLAHLESHAQIISRKTLLHTYSVTKEQAALFVQMTPMTLGLSPEILENICFSQITLHLELVICQRK